MSRIRPGTIIDGRYELESLLGEGGYGVVYRARQLSTGQAVALKFLLRDRLTSAREERVEGARFVRELKLVAQLKHPNIVRLLDSGTAEEKHPYMVLELVEGETLFRVVQREGALAREEAAHLMFQVLDAMAFAHERGVIHRDLKPQNVMLTRGGFRRNAMILDFGVAGILKHARGASYVSLTARDEVRGTPAYMAPEQLLQGPLTPQTDIYAWGLLFIETLTGSTAVSAATPFEAAMRQADEDPIPVPAEIEDPELRRILARAIEKPLARRYATAAEALVELQAWLGTFHSTATSSQPALAPSAAETAPPESTPREPEAEAAPPPAQPVQPPRGSRRTGLVIALLAALFLVATGGFIWWTQNSPARVESTASTAPVPCSARAHGCAEGELCAPSGACVALEQAGCTIGEGELPGPSSRAGMTLLVGTIGYHDHPAYVAREQAVRLAVQEINESGGLPGGRRLLHLSCNDYGQPERAVAAAEHLVALGAVGIIGPSSSEAMLQVVTRVTRAAGVVTISPGATSPAISALDDAGLALRTVPSDLAQGAAIASRVEGLMPREAVVLARGDAYGTGLLDVISARLAVPLGGGLHAARLPVGGGELPATVRQAMRPDADVVVVLATEEAAEIVRTWEWSLPEDAAQRPRYVLSEAGRRSEVLALLREMPSLIGRLEVVGPSDRSAAVYPSFAVRHAARFGPLGEASKVANAYDAVWVLAMLLATSGTEPEPSGAAMVARLPDLVGGEPVAVGPGEASRAMRQLAEGKRIDLEGASGRLDFDPVTGDVAADTVLWRAQLDLRGEPTFELAGRVEDGPEGVRWTIPVQDVEGVWRKEPLAFARVVRPAPAALSLDVATTPVSRQAWQRLRTAERSPCEGAPADHADTAPASGVGSVAPVEAQQFCASLGLRLPTTAELVALAATVPAGAHGSPDGVYGLGAEREFEAEWTLCEAEAQFDCPAHGIVAARPALASPDTPRTLAPPPDATEAACQREASIGFRCVRPVP